jgi:hypothetical protein
MSKRYSIRCRPKLHVIIPFYREDVWERIPTSSEIKEEGGGRIDLLQGWHG